MKNVAQFSNTLKVFSGLFTMPAYKTFKAVIHAMVKLANYSQANLANISGKTIAQIQYFFSRAKWSYAKLNLFRLRWLRNRKEFRNRKSDDVILDGSVIKKDRDAKFSGLAAFMYSNLSKGVVNGLALFGASIRTTEGKRYPLDFMLFVEKQWLSQWKAWQAFAEHLSHMTKGMLWILDRGFRNQYFLAHILKLKRLFLIRVSISLNVLIPMTQKEIKAQEKKDKLKKQRGRKKQFPNRKLVSVEKWMKKHVPTQCKGGELWIIPHVIVNAWQSQIKQECTVIIFHRDGFKNPLVLVYSQQEAGEEMHVKKALEFVGKYIGRWTIEIFFKEAKSWFDLEGFGVRSREGIYRFIHMVFFTHSLLSIILETLNKLPNLKQVILFILEKSRNIKTLVVIGLKLFFESISFICLRPPKWLDLKTKRTLEAYFF